jgi:hypothetical protein
MKEKSHVLGFYINVAVLNVASRLKRDNIYKIERERENEKLPYMHVGMCILCRDTRSKK